MQYTSLINRFDREAVDATPLEWLLIQYIRDANRWAKSIVREGRPHYWLAKSKIVDDLPELRSPANVAKYLYSLTCKGIIEVVMIAGKQAYYRVVDELPPRRGEGRPKLLLKPSRSAVAEQADADKVDGREPCEITNLVNAEQSPEPIPPQEVNPMLDATKPPRQNFPHHLGKFSESTSENFRNNSNQKHIIDPVITYTDIVQRAPARDEIPSSDGEYYRPGETDLEAWAVKFPRVYIWDSIERMRKKYIARPWLRRPLDEMRSAVEQWLAGDNAAGGVPRCRVEVTRPRSTRDLTLREMLNDRSWAA